MSLVSNIVSTFFETFVNVILYFRPTRRAIQQLARWRMFGKLRALGVDQAIEEKRLLNLLGDLDRALSEMKNSKVKYPGEQAIPAEIAFLHLSL